MVLGCFGVLSCVFGAFGVVFPYFWVILGFGVGWGFDLGFGC